MKDTDIKPNVRRAVKERDAQEYGYTRCVYCGTPYFIEIAHYVSRGRGGKGIPENLVCLCSYCHRMLDNGSDIERMRDIKRTIENHLRSKYKDWDELNLGGRR